MDLFWAGSGALAVAVAVIVLLAQMVDDLRQDGVNQLEQSSRSPSGAGSPSLAPSASDGAPGPSQPTATPEIRRAIVRSRPEGVLQIRSLPSPLSEATGEVPEGEEVQIQCVLAGGEAVGPDGVPSDLWARIPGGYVPDVDLQTAPGQPPVPSCE
ncbi:MAG: hypothetical protein QG608_3189 [Actinomycetota bacterium]|nr:hypothetical protein [Actinomycetota bacterium]